MRRILFVLFIPFSMLSHATTYYVSSGGDDFYNGTSELTPWKTIAKVNSIFSSLQPGDKVLLKCGDTFYGTLKITKSGSAGSPITIGAYGTGEKPIISGFTTISSWINEGNGIYSKIITCESAPEMVTINGVQYGMGRYPNTTWLTVDSHSGDVSITDADVNSALTNWTGAELVQRKPTLYTTDRYKITSHVSHTLNYSGSGLSNPLDGYGYFIQNDIRTLDSFGEWFYNTGTSTFYMYFGSVDPNSKTVQISTIDDIVTFTAGIYYLTFDNISFKGANHNALNLNSNNYVTIQNCILDFSGYSGIRGYSSQHITATNNDINHSNDIGIFLYGWYCNYADINKNTIRNSGLILGIGSCQDNSGNGMSIIASNYSIIENNEIYDVGFNGISFSGDGLIVRNNFVNRFCLRKEDGGGIYYGGQDVYSNITITENIVINGIGSVWGKPITITTSMAAGIYLDYYTTGGAKISNNTIAHSNWNGIFLHGNQNVEVINNTVYDITNCIKFQENAGLGCPSRNITMTGNLFFAKDVSQTPLFLNSTNNDFDQFGTFDNNFFAKPLDNAKPIRPEINWSGNSKTLTEWHTLYGHDANSHISPIALTDTADIDFYYNETKSDKVITLIQPMIDVKGTQYLNSVTLAPFTSIVLMVDPNPPVPVVPVYISSVIQNPTPTKLEITYSVNLDPGKVPSVNDFLVKGTTMSVTAVTISGTKVTLTLSGAVSFGDVITLSYTPGTIPLQTPSLGLAASLTDKAVINNLVDPTIPNDPPVVTVNYPANAYSGFVYELDASGTTDPNSDLLTYTWTPPVNFPVSATDGSKIKFLAPEVSASQDFNFLLNVYDGRVIVSKNITINISPYKPELDAARITIITASGSQPPDTPENVNDDDLTTKWSVNGDNQWLLFKLVGSYRISHISMAFLTGQEYVSYFDIYASKDNVSWEPILIKAASCGFSGDVHVFDFPEAKTESEYLYIKIVGHGSSINTLNTISELKIFGLFSGNPGSVDSENKNVVIYPNPAQDFFKITIAEPAMRPDKVRLINSSGKILFENLLESEIINVQIPALIKSGIYIVELRSGKIILDAQMLVINKSEPK